jgi:hypothetical protein
VLLVLFLLPSLACSVVIPTSTNAVRGSGNIVTETVDVSNFDSVSLEISGDVYIEQGEAESVTIEADDNILPLLETKVSGKELILTAKPNQNINPSRKIVYRITVNNLRGISLDGSGNFYISPIQSDSMDISLLGSGDINFDDIETGKLALDLNGSGNIDIEQLIATETDA